MSDKKIKCIIWDLDNTIWHGVLSEGDNLILNEEIVSIIKEFDNRGILNSIASKNDFAQAAEKLKEFGIFDYFIYPHISWNPKSNAVMEIGKQINIGIDTLAFIDDQEFELDEVSYSLPEVSCLNVSRASEFLHMSIFNPKYVTTDSKLRRQLYQTDIIRNQVEKDFIGTEEEFLRSLEMEFTIESAKKEDLKRCEELTVRTHQLNATGYTYSYEELESMIDSDKHILLTASLKDKYGTYGKIGIALLEIMEDDSYRLNLLLMSCRVMSRGVGSILLAYIINYVRSKGKKLQAEFIPTDRNRVMYITYKFGGFNEIGVVDNIQILEYQLDRDAIIPDYVKVKGFAD